MVVFIVNLFITKYLVYKFIINLNKILINYTLYIKNNIYTTKYKQYMYKNGKIKSEVRLMIKGNVLLVDDDKDIVESMEIHLKNEGLKVYKAYDGIEALEILLEKEIHLILMDIMMPRMDGLSATLKIREEKIYQLY